VQAQFCYVQPFRLPTESVHLSARRLSRESPLDGSPDTQTPRQAWGNPRGDVITQTSRCPLINTANPLFDTNIIHKDNIQILAIPPEVLTLCSHLLTCLVLLIVFLKSFLRRFHRFVLLTPFSCVPYRQIKDNSRSARYSCPISKGYSASPFLY
jgi:hypothetical protein